MQTILVCQGAEYAAVCRGLKAAGNSSLAIATQFPEGVIVPIPVGPAAVTRSLAVLLQQDGLAGAEIVVTGLCGSLSDRHRVGDVVIYERCAALTDAADLRWHECDRALTDRLQSRLGQAARVKALTSDRMIHTAVEKHHLGSTYSADVVDMEGSAILQTLKSANVAIAMIRVVSDDCQHDLPDLTSTVDAEGKLRSLPMAIALIRQPVAAIRLIRGSLQALKQLQQIAPDLL